MIEQTKIQEIAGAQEYERIILELSRKMRTALNKEDITVKKQTLENLDAAFLNADFRKRLFKNLPDFFHNLEQIDHSPEEETAAILFKENLLIASIVAEVHQNFSTHRGYSLIDIEEHIRSLCPVEDSYQKAFLNHVTFQAIDYLTKLPTNREMIGQLEQERIRVIDVMLDQQKRSMDYQPCPRNDKEFLGSPSPNESVDAWHDNLDTYKKPLDQFLDRMSALAEKLHREKRTDLFAHFWVEKLGDQDNPQYALKTFGLTNHDPAGEDDIGFDRTPVELTIMLTPAEAYELLRLEQFGKNAKEMVKQKAEALFLQKTFSANEPVGSWEDWSKRREANSLSGLPNSGKQPFHIMIHGWGGIPFVWDEQISETVANLAKLNDPTLANQIWCSFGLQGSMMSIPECLFTEKGEFDRQKLKDFQEEDLLFQPTQAFLEITRSMHRIQNRCAPVRNAEGNLVITRNFTKNEHILSDLVVLQKISTTKEGFFIPTGKIDFSLAEIDLFHETLKNHQDIVNPALEKINEQLHNLDFEILEFFQKIYGFPLNRFRQSSPAFAAIESWRTEFYIDSEKALDREKLDRLAKEIISSSFFDQMPNFDELFRKELAEAKTSILNSKREVKARETIAKVRQGETVSDDELKAAAETIAYYYQSNDSDFAIRLFKVLKNQQAGKLQKGVGVKLWDTISNYLDREPPIKKSLRNRIEMILEKNGIQLSLDLVAEIDQFWNLLLSEEVIPPEKEESSIKLILDKVQTVLDEYKKNKIEEFVGNTEKSINIWGERTNPLRELLSSQKSEIDKAEDYWKENLEKILFVRTVGIETDLDLLKRFKAKNPDQEVTSELLRQLRPELGYRIDQLKNLAKLAGWDQNDYAINDEDFLQAMVIKHRLSQELDEPRLFSLAEIAIKQHTLASLTEFFGHSMGGKIARALARGLRPDSAVKPSPLAQLYRSLNVSPKNVQFIASNEVVHGSRLTADEEAKAIDWMGKDRKDMVTLHSRAVGGFLVQGKSILTNPIIGALGQTFGIERAVLLWYMGAMKSATPLLMHEWVYQQPSQMQQQIGSWLLRNMPFFIRDENTLNEDRWLASRGIVVPQIGMDDNILWPGDGVLGNRMVGSGEDAIAISAGLNHYPESDQMGRALAIMRLLRNQAVADSAGKDLLINWNELKARGLPENGITPEEIFQIFPRLVDLEPKDTRSGMLSFDLILEEIKAKLPKLPAKTKTKVQEEIDLIK